MKPIVIWLLAIAIIVFGMVFYRSCTSGRDLNVDPHARKEIEKAKER